MKECGRIDRARIRAEAERIFERSRDQRQQQREHYAWATDGGWGFGKLASTRYKGKRYSAAESDSLAEGSIPEHLIGLWRKNKVQFPRSLEPDHRAEVFLEWVVETPGAVDAYWNDLEDSLTDASYDKAYAMYLEEEAAEQGEPAELAEQIRQLEEITF